MSRRETPTPSLVKRICKAVAQGAPVEFAARQQGVDVETLARWMQRGQKGRGKYRDFVLAVDKAEAQAVVDYTVLVKKAASRGKASAAFRMLASRAPQFFPSTSHGGTAGDGQQRFDLRMLLDLAKDIDNMSMQRCAALDAMSRYPSVGFLQSIKSARLALADDNLTLGAEEITPLPETPVALSEASTAFVPLTSVVEPGTLPVGGDPNMIEMVRVQP